MTKKKPMGRPRIDKDGPLVLAGAWVPKRHVDALAVLAAKRGLTVSALLRKVITRKVSTAKRLGELPDSDTDSLDVSR